MTPEQLAARWLADVERFTPPYTRGNRITEADALAAIARHLAPGDDLVAQAHEYAAMMRQDWDDWHSDEVADCKASTADVLDEAAARIAAQEAQIKGLEAERNAAITIAETAIAEADTLRAKVAELVKAAKRVLAPLDEPCRYDHHGYCQEHFIEADCSVAALRAAIAKLETR